MASLTVSLSNQLDSTGKTPKISVMDFGHAVTKFHLGQTVGIPCQIQDGAFSSEYLISIETDDQGVLTGFADVNSVVLDPRNTGRGMIKGTVVALDSNSVKVRIQGSFFTIASGTTVFSPQWADANFLPA
jgi:hypothetical protein